MTNQAFRSLQRFRSTFEGTIYRHRSSTIGNKIGRELFEDLLRHEVSARYREHADKGVLVVNRGGKVHTPRAIRRNDSVCGKPPAGVRPRRVPGFYVREGPVAEPRIGCEVKIIAKAQQKQIDRVINDLDGFVRRVKTLNRKCINVAIVGVNHEHDYVGFEGERAFRDTLRKGEPETITAKLKDQLQHVYDELVILPFKATNQPPFPFEWVDPRRAELDYGAALTRIGELYQQRFR